ncbi:MAG: hypothetical protein IIA27_15025 [Gemmatimonadetes bacterium]|nr:hypothetical protein [Gemmatimonadota bacterium]
MSHICRQPARTFLVILAITALMGVATTPSAARQDEPTPREQFDRLSSSLARLSDDYVNDTMKTISFLLLIMGWFITSERSREYLRANRPARSATLTAIPAVALMHAFLTHRFYAGSQAKVRALERLSYLGPDFYADDAVTLALLTANVAIHLILFGTLFVLVWALKHEPPTTSS